MTELRHELLWLITRNHAERWVPSHVALKHLQHHGEQLIPALGKALCDDDSEVRLLSITLLDEAGENAVAVLPELVKAISDPNQYVGMAAAQCIAKFGTRAAAVVPFLLHWLNDNHPFVRIVAAVTILRLDPTRVNLIPLVDAARFSADPMIQHAAEQFLNDD